MNAGQNFLNGLEQGRAVGDRIRSRKTDQGINKILYGQNKAMLPQDMAGNAPGMDKYAQARDYAAERGDLQAAQGLDAQIKSMTAEQAQQATQRAQAVSKLAFAGTQLPPEQQAGYIRYWGPQLGFDPNQVEQVAANPSLLKGIAAQSEDFIKMLAKNGESFTLSQGQSRFSGQGGEIASVAPAAKVLADGGQLVGNDGALLAVNEKDAPQAAPISEYQQQSLNLKRAEIEQKANASQLTPYQSEMVGFKRREEEQKQKERQSELQQQGNRLKSFEQKVTGLIDVIDTAISQTDAGNTGFIGSKNPTATDLDGNLRTIQANAAFDALQEMRDNSKTGGALGQVSERELALLQAQVADVQRSQNEQQLDANLKKFKRTYQQSLERVRKAYEQDMRANSAPIAGRAPQKRKRYNPETGKLEEI